MLNSTIKSILDNYTGLRALPYFPTRYPESSLITQQFPKEIVTALSLNEAEYKVNGSVGTGSWAETPWVAIFDRKITVSATKGYYIVYLFRKDMQGVYLSLGLGTAYITSKYKGLKPRDKIFQIAGNLRRSLYYNKEHFNVTNINLTSTTPNAKSYEAGHILGRYYPIDQIPSDEELIEDLSSMLELYSQLKSIVNNRQIDEMLDFYIQIDEIEDTQFQADVELAEPIEVLREPQPLPVKSTINSRESWKRDSGIAKGVLMKSNYICELDMAHITFKSSITKENFVEAHHLVPISFQGDFEYSLDVPGNIVSLCPNCHRRIHHADKIEKKEVIKKLFEKKKDALEEYGIVVDVNMLYHFYNCR